jgi:hypothetical protein
VRLTKQRVFVWCGPAMMVLFLLGLLIAHWVAPPQPSETAHQIATMYRMHAGAIRVGILLSVVGATLLGPFVAVVSAQLTRIEGRLPVSSYCQLMLGGVLILEIILPLMVMATAALRPARSDDAILALNDEGWLLLAGLVTTISLELVVIGFTVLKDRRVQPVFPRWAAWFNFICAVPIGCGAFDIFSTTGPFAWNGLLAWWGAVGTFGTWLVVMTVLLLRAIAQEADEAHAPAVPDGFEFDSRQEIARLSGELVALRGEVALLSQAPVNAATDSRSAPSQ